MRKFPKLLLPILSITWFCSCSSEKKNPKEKQPQSYDFTISGNINNISNKKIYLQELPFSNRNPVIMDSALIKGGKFKLSAKAAEEGLYRIFTEDNASFIFVNDQRQLELKASDSSLSVQKTQIESPSNSYLNTVIRELEQRSSELNIISQSLNDPKVIADPTLHLAQEKLMNNKVEEYNNFLLKKFRETTDPIIASFTLVTLVNTSIPNPMTIKESVEDLSKRFPDHKVVAAVVKDFKSSIDANQQSSSLGSDDIIAIGKPAPDFNMNDVDGKSFSLNELRGKYVLIDFWASWCGPCRGENPNVVAAYKKFKDKNFTVLGVSLDEDKNKWMEAIKADALTWKHVSDLKGWGSPVVSMYGFNGIPYNVLIDPNGIVLAKELRGADLEMKIADFIKK